MGSEGPLDQSINRSGEQFSLYRQRERFLLAFGSILIVAIVVVVVVVVVPRFGYNDRICWDICIQILIFFFFYGSFVVDCILFSSIFFLSSSESGIVLIDSIGAELFVSSFQNVNFQETSADS
jgi:hypothetical protein